jgi:hypothetical protein
MAGSRSPLCSTRRSAIRSLFDRGFAVRADLTAAAGRRRNQGSARGAEATAAHVRNEMRRPAPEEAMSAMRTVLDFNRANLAEQPLNALINDLIERAEPPSENWYCQPSTLGLLPGLDVPSIKAHGKFSRVVPCGVASEIPVGNHRWDRTTDRTHAASPSVSSPPAELSEPASCRAKSAVCACDRGPVS